MQCNSVRTFNYSIPKQISPPLNVAHLISISLLSFLCGVKGNFQTIGVNGRVAFNDCPASNNPSNQVKSLIHLAQEAKKRTGVVTTTRITHATPAATYAHVSNRNFECDSNVLANATNPTQCLDIARQLIENEPGKNINVLLGGGRSNFVPNTMFDAGATIGARSDGRNLINQWIDSKPHGRFVVDKETMLKMDVKNTDHVLGLFTPSHMEYNLDADQNKQPSLAEMTETAIKLLDKGDNGYVLFVEGNFRLYLDFWLKN